MALFDTTEPTGKGDAFIQATKTRALIRGMAQADSLDLSETDLAEGEMCCVVTCKMVNAFAFVLSAVRKFGTLDRLALATYRIGMDTTNTLAQMVQNGTIRRCDLLINDNGGTFKPEITARLVELDRDGFISLWLQNNHAKTFAIQCGDVCLSIVGSGNLTDNGRVEQYLIIRDRAFYKWNLGWICKTDMGNRRRAVL